MLSLRTYQKHLAIKTFTSLQKSKRVCSVLATGGGKSRVMAQVAKYALKQGMAKNIYVVCHSVDILTQLEKTFKASGFSTSWLAASKPYNPHVEVYFISGNTLLRRVNMPRWQPFITNLLAKDSLVLADEVHRSLSKKVGDIFYPSACRISGWTATPWKLGKDTLANHFDILVAGPLPVTLVKRGYLAPGRYIEPPKAKTSTSSLSIGVGDFSNKSVSKYMRDADFIEDMITFIFKTAPTGKFIFFVADTAHANAVITALRRAGHKAELILADTEGRSSAIAKIRDSKDIHGVSINVLSTGIDIPDLAGVVLLRHTMSRVIHFQQIGRALRTYQQKEYAWVFDFVGNCARHGIPEGITKYAFDEQKQKKHTRDIGQKTCPVCGALNGALRLSCFSCGFVFEDKCPTCGHLMYFTQDICKYCGFDRRSDEERLLAAKLAQEQLEALKMSMKRRFWRLLDKPQDIWYNYTIYVRKSVHQNAPLLPLTYLRKLVNTPQDLIIFQEVTKYSLWPKEEVLKNPEEYYRGYATWLIDWVSPIDGQVLDPADIELLMGLQFGQEGRAFLDHFVTKPTTWKDQLGNK